MPDPCAARSADPPARAAPSPGAPLLNPALPALWRDSATVQLGLDEDRALVIHRADPTTRALLRRLDGRHSEAEILARAAADGHDLASVTTLLRQLQAAGAVVDGDPAALADLGGPGEADRLAPDLGSLSLLARHGGPSAAARVRRRRAAQVVVHGATRIGVPLASALAAAGVGRVAVVEEGRARLADANTGGLRPADEGRAGPLAAAQAMQRVAPGVDTEIRVGDRPELAVLCQPWPTERLRGALQAAGTPHLCATVRETTAVLGPLVIPGRTGCLRCADLHRSDRDRCWPALLAQLSERTRTARDPLDGSLALLVAAAAALQVTAFLDSAGQIPVPVHDASIELRLPEWRPRRRSWPAHPRCPCGAFHARAGMMAG